MSLNQSYTDAFNQAQAANQARYDGLMGYYQNIRRDFGKIYEDNATAFQDRYNRGMGMINQLGEQQKIDARRQYAQFGAQQDQAMISRGLGNTTARNAVAQGNNEELANAMGRINDQIMRQRVGADAQLSGDFLQSRQRYADYVTNVALQHANAMERRTDEYPNYAQYQQLAYQQGQALAAAQRQQQQYAYNFLNGGYPQAWVNGVPLGYGY